MVMLDNDWEDRSREAYERERNEHPTLKLSRSAFDRLLYLAGRNRWTVARTLERVLDLAEEALGMKAP